MRILYLLFSGNENNRTPSKNYKLRQKWSERDEACFGTPIDDTIEQDFDFEKNLALFNKKVCCFTFS